MITRDLDLTRGDVNCAAMGWTAVPFCPRFRPG